MQSDIKKKTKDKKIIIGHCEKQMRDAEIQADRACIKLIEKFRSEMKHMTRLIEKEKAKENDNMYKILDQHKELIGTALN